MTRRTPPLGFRQRLAGGLLCLWSVGTAHGAGDPPRLIADGALVYDRKTDLTWSRCSLGQRWDAQRSTCAGEAARITFDEAKALEGRGWRIPTLDELSSIVRPDSVPTIDSRIFPGTPPQYYWATDNRDTTASWYVWFENGRTNHYFPPRTNRDRVRYVRTGRWQGDAGPVLPAGRKGG